MSQNRDRFVALASMWDLFRICEHCNKEYKLDRQYEREDEIISNFQTCPHCGKRDDAWIKLKRITPEIVSKQRYTEIMQRIEELLPLVNEETPLTDMNLLELVKISILADEYENVHYKL